ncbi:hypothetical protein A5766_15130 [Gordonia sp. 852002-51296_SCH5728562-b]|nr:hypothetical protein A5766_15130 [Gordonia sp. 852002-51296_SCH5728562-b]
MNNFSPAAVIVQAARLPHRPNDRVPNAGNVPAQQRPDRPFAQQQIGIGCCGRHGFADAGEVVAHARRRVFRRPEFLAFDHRLAVGRVASGLLGIARQLAKSSPASTTSCS